MKAAAFDLIRPPDFAAALMALGGPATRLLSGGQSLGPMLNLRVVRPACLVQISHLPDLGGITETPQAISIGACTTHARIASRPAGILASVAGGIAYQAVRNRGTIGGSLAHADPAADWVNVLTALDASVTLRSTTGTRMVLVADLITGAYTTTLAAGEILTAVHIPQCAGPVAWGYVKACRKPGEFAHAMAAVLIAGGTRRLVIGATGGAPLLLTGDQASLEGAAEALADLDPVDRRMQSVVVHRALQQADVCATSL